MLQEERTWPPLNQHPDASPPTLFAMALTASRSLLLRAPRRAISSSAPAPAPAPQLAYLRADGAAAGAYLPPAECKVRVDDRGFTFADSLYEVAKSYGGGALFTWAPHLARLRRGLDALRIGADDAERDALLAEVTAAARALLRRNALDAPGQRATVYVQITRGSTAPRAHAFPPAPAPPNVFVAAKPFAEPPEQWLSGGVGGVTVPDTRWARCDLKTTGLLANVLANQQAKAAGAYEALFLRGAGADCAAVEASHSNVFAVVGGELVTHPLGDNILPGITREVILRRAGELGVRAREGRVLLSDLRPGGRATELFTTATTTEIMPIVRLDGQAMGSSGGAVGPVARKLREAWPRWVAEDVASGGK